MNRSFLFFVCCVFSVSNVAAENLQRTEQKNIPYYSADVWAKADDYQKSQCRLKISAPKDRTEAKLPVLVWFHGGGLTGGSLEYPGQSNPALIMNENIILVGAGYRLSPKADFPAFIEDAVAAVAWTFANIESYGGDSKKIFIGGMSAGGYLSGLVGLDPRRLAVYNIDNKRLAGIIIQSGQVTTHFHVKQILGTEKYPKPRYQPVIDENAPLFYLSKDAPPLLLTTGDRTMDMPVRVQENEMMYASLKALEHPFVEFYEHKGYDHGKVAAAPESFERIRQFIQKVLDR